MRRKVLVGMLLCAIILFLCTFYSNASTSTLYVPDDYSKPTTPAEPPESKIVNGYADTDFYYLACYSEDDSGTIYVYERDTLNLHTTISVPHPRNMDSHGSLFVCAFHGPSSPFPENGIAIYDKKSDFMRLKIIGQSGTSRQPMIDNNYIMVPVDAGGGNNPLIMVYDSIDPFNLITTVKPARGDANDGADDDDYVAIATAWYGYHQYVYEKGTWDLVADIVGPGHGNGMAFYQGDHDYLFNSYHWKHGRPAEYIKYDYHDLTGPYEKKVVTPEFEVIQDIVACPPYILISGYWETGEYEFKLQVRDAETDEIVANYKPTFDGWIQWLGYFPTLTPTPTSSHEPILTNGNVEPEFSCDYSDTFEFSVVYKDEDGDKPVDACLRIMGFDGVKNVYDKTKEMKKVGGEIRQGATYSYRTTLKESGEYCYYFYFNDRQGHNVYLPSGGYPGFNGPDVGMIGGGSLSELEEELGIEYGYDCYSDEDFILVIFHVEESKAYPEVSKVKLVLYDKNSECFSDDYEKAFELYYRYYLKEHKNEITKHMEGLLSGEVLLRPHIGVVGRGGIQEVIDREAKWAQKNAELTSLDKFKTILTAESLEFLGGLIAAYTQKLAAQSLGAVVTAIQILSLLPTAEGYINDAGNVFYSLDSRSTALHIVAGEFDEAVGKTPKHQLTDFVHNTADWEDCKMSVDSDYKYDFSELAQHYRENYGSLSEVRSNALDIEEWKIAYTGKYRVEEGKGLADIVNVKIYKRDLTLDDLLFTEIKARNPNIIMKWTYIDKFYATLTGAWVCSAKGKLEETNNRIQAFADDSDPYPSDYRKMVESTVGLFDRIRISYVYKGVVCSQKGQEEDETVANQNAGYWRDNTENVIRIYLLFSGTLSDSIEELIVPGVEKQPSSESPKKEKEIPGFEAIFAIARLLAIAYILRRRGWS